MNNYSTSASISVLCVADIEQAMHLVTAAGWNQTSDDWQRLIEYQPTGCFKATRADRLVGTVTSTAYGRKLAWIGKMLVDPEYRRQGMGRTLMQVMIDHLQADQIETIKLDATPLGQPLYEQLGFATQFKFRRWFRPATTSAIHFTNSTTLQLKDGVRQSLDLRAFGVDRMAWLQRVADASVVSLDMHGFGMRRSGRIADYLGPVVADTIDAAAFHIQQLVHSTEAALFWDICPSRPAVEQLALALGFNPVRDLTRMVLGEDRTQPDLQMQFALCDPACG